MVGEWSTTGGTTTLHCAGITSNATTTATNCGLNLGNTYGVPQIRRFHNGEWGAVFGNGFGSSTGSTFGGTGAIGGGPIVGVASLSRKKSIMEVKGKDHYNDLEFIYDPTQDYGGVAGLTGTSIGAATNLPGSGTNTLTGSGFGSNSGSSFGSSGSSSNFGSGNSGSGNSGGGFGNSGNGSGDSGNNGSNNNNGNGNNGSGNNGSGNNGSGNNQQ